MIWAILIGCVFLLGTIAAVAVVVYLWIKRRLYTRERFAFFAVASIVGVWGVALASIGGGLWPWDILVQVVNWILGASFVSPTMSVSSQVLILIGAMFCTQYVYRVHANWDGATSKAHFQAQQMQAPRGMLGEARDELLRAIRREPPPGPYDPPSVNDFLPNLGRLQEPRPWKESARTLFQLRHNTYRVDAEDGWREDMGCWVGRRADPKQRFALKCCVALPTPQEVADFVRFGNRCTPPIDELLIAVEQASLTKTIIVEQRAIRIVSRETLLADIVDLTNYSLQIKRRVEVHCLPESTLAIKDVYVRSDFKTINGAKKTDLESYIDAWLAESGGRQLAILGEYGQGKSTVALMLTHRIMECRDRESGRIPVLVELRGKSPRSMTPEELIAGWSHAHGLNASAVLELHAAGRVLLIFDGFDEMALVGDREMRLEHFQTLWQFNTPGAKVIITGRPNFFLDDEELKIALGIERVQTASPSCEALRLEPFSLEQIQLALRNWPSSTRQQICEAARHNPRLYELASRPGMLHVIAVLWEREKLRERAGNLTSADVMALFVERSYRRQGVKAKDGRPFMALNSPERKYFMQGIAAYMAGIGETNQITGPDLIRVVQRLASVCPDRVSQQADAMTGETRTPIRIRLAESQDLLKRIQDDVRTCGLIVDDPSAAGRFRFAHKSFLEFLAADVAAGAALESQNPVFSAIRSVVRTPHSDLLRTRVSLAYYGELLLRHDATKRGEEVQFRDSVRAERLMTILLRPSRITRLRWMIGLRSILGISAYGPTSLLPGFARGVLAALTRVSLLHEFTIMDSREVAWRSILFLTAFPMGVAVAFGTEWREGGSGKLLVAFLFPTFAMLFAFLSGKRGVAVRHWIHVCAACGIRPIAIRETLGGKTHVTHEADLTDHSSIPYPRILEDESEFHRRFRRRIN